VSGQVSYIPLRGSVDLGNYILPLPIPISPPIYSGLAERFLDDVVHLTR
jgi:hypothetical protein